MELSKDSAMHSVRHKVLSNLQNFGQFLMRGRRESAIAAMLTAAVPFLGWISLAIVCLVTLRKGMREGFFVLCWSIIPAVISSYVMTSGPIALESFIAYIWLWGMAGLLRATASWRYVLEVSSGIAIAIILLFHGLVPNLNEVYSNYLIELYQNSKDSSANYAEMQNYIQALSYYLLGVQTTLYMIHNLFCLLIARGLQAMLYNPQGLSKDLKVIRLGWLPWIIGAALLFSGMQMSYLWALDTFPVLVALFLCAGLSVVHYGIKEKVKFKGALLIFYLLLILLLPFSILLVSLIALIDTGWNIRKIINTR